MVTKQHFSKSIILDWSLQFWISSLFKAEAGYNKNYNAEKLYLLGNWLFSLIIITWLTGVIHNTQVQSSLVGGLLYSPLLPLSARDLLKIDFMVSFVLGIQEQDVILL